MDGSQVKSMHAKKLNRFCGNARSVRFKKKGRNYLFSQWNSINECLKRLLWLLLMRPDCFIPGITRTQIVINNLEKKSAPDCCFRWKPPISKKPALILRFRLAGIDLSYVSVSHVIDVINLETRLCFLANHERVDRVSGNPLKTGLSRVFSLLRWFQFWSISSHMIFLSRKHTHVRTWSNSQKRRKTLPWE